MAVQLAQGNLLTDKYAEGFAGHRFYAGCDNVDEIERTAADLAGQVFGADHAYVQPHSGADANLVAFLAVLAATVESPALEALGERNPAAVTDADWARLRQDFVGQRLLGMDYYSGGHLTHGYRHNVSTGYSRRIPIPSIAILTCLISTPSGGRLWKFGHGFS